jgi:hypothetical protein
LGLSNSLLLLLLLTHVRISTALGLHGESGVSGGLPGNNGRDLRVGGQVIANPDAVGSHNPGVFGTASLGAIHNQFALWEGNARQSTGKYPNVVAIVDSERT